MSICIRASGALLIDCRGVAHGLVFAVWISYGCLSAYILWEAIQLEQQVVNFAPFPVLLRQLLCIYPGLLLLLLGLKRFGPWVVGLLALDDLLLRIRHGLVVLFLCHWYKWLRITA